MNAQQNDPIVGAVEAHAFFTGHDAGVCGGIALAHGAPTMPQPAKR